MMLDDRSLSGKFREVSRRAETTWRKKCREGEV